MKDKLIDNRPKRTRTKDEFTANSFRRTKDKSIHEGQLRELGLAFVWRVRGGNGMGAFEG